MKNLFYKLLCIIGLHDWRVYMSRGTITITALHPVCARCLKPKSCEPIETVGSQGPIINLKGEIERPGKRPDNCHPALWN